MAMNLKTTYMGLALKNPLVVSASPLQQKLDNVRAMEDAGASAIVMFSLFEEQIMQESQAIDDFMDFAGEAYAESRSYFPAMGDYDVGVEQYLTLLERAVEATDIPIIGSLNGTTQHGWVDYARRMQEAGVAGIELNVFYIPANLDERGVDVETRYLEILAAVKAAVSIPVAVKLSPFFSSIGNMCKQLDEKGADALVLFNRFYQPDFDIENQEVVPNLQLSTASEIRLPLLWTAILHGKVKASLAATRGVETAEQVIKYIMAGSDVVMTTSALLRNGIPYLKTLRKDMELWMHDHEYESVEQMKGSMSQSKVDDPTAFERANYIKLLKSWKPTDTPA